MFHYFNYSTTASVPCLLILLCSSSQMSVIKNKSHHHNLFTGSIMCKMVVQTGFLVGPWTIFILFAPSRIVWLVYCSCCWHPNIMWWWWGGEEWEENEFEMWKTPKNMDDIKSRVIIMVTVDHYHVIILSLIKVISCYLNPKQVSSPIFRG